MYCSTAQPFHARTIKEAQKFLDTDSLKQLKTQIDVFFFFFFVEAVSAPSGAEIKGCITVVTFPSLEVCLPETRDFWGKPLGANVFST